MKTERFGFTEHLALCDRLGLRPISFGWQCQAFPEGVPRPRTLNMFELVWLEEGCHDHESAAGGLQHAQAGSVLLNFPGMWHRYGPPQGKPAKHYYLIFDGALAKRWLEQGLFPPTKPVLKPASSKRFGDLVKTLWDRVRAEPKQRSLNFVQGLLQLIPELVRQSEQKAGLDERCQRLCQAMAQQRHTPNFDVPTWCAAKGWNYEALRKQFKREIGLSPVAYFAQQKLALVKEYLSQGTASIHELAQAAGFEDPYYFSRWFKKLEQLSPKTYRGLFYR